MALVRAAATGLGSGTARLGGVSLANLKVVGVIADYTDYDVPVFHNLGTSAVSSATRTRIRRIVQA